MNLFFGGMALLLAVGTQAQAAPTAAEQAAIEAAAAAMEAARDDVVAVDAAAGLFDPTRDAMADVDAALSAARISGKNVLLILGGDWCHDSIALTDTMAIPRTAAMLAARYEIVRVHVPYGRDERQLPVAQRFGIASVEGTPTVLILRPDGTVTNREDAPRWRNAASRKPAAIHRALERAAPAPPVTEAG
jgi:Thioredoxin-like